MFVRIRAAGGALLWPSSTWSKLSVDSFLERFVAGEAPIDLFVQSRNCIYFPRVCKIRLDRGKSRRFLEMGLSKFGIKKTKFLSEK